MNVAISIKTFLIAVFLGTSVLAQTNQPLQILVVTGGKEINEAEFFSIFEDNEQIASDTISKPAAFSLFESPKIEKYDAVVFYDGYRSTTDTEKHAFLKLFKKGIGCLFLHHALISHPNWKEYKQIIGGKYHYEPWEHRGKKFGPSTYKHDQEVMVKMLDNDHPILKNIPDFSIHDETYINIEINDDVHPILTTNNCESMDYVGWTKSYLNSDIVYIQPGDDKEAYRNKHYRQLIYNALVWLSQ